MGKQNEKQRVKIREDKRTDSTASLLLDWSLDKKRQREYLGLIVFIKPKTILEKQHNKDVYAQAEILRKKREYQFIHGEIKEIAEKSKNQKSEFHSFFNDYVSKYSMKDKRVMVAVQKLLIEFAPPPLTVSSVNKTFCIDFKKFLENRLNGETPQGYFARFKKFLEFASDEDNKNRLFSQNPAYKIKNTKKENSIQKDTLTVEELRALAVAECGNKEVKRAFLFACNTGLRFVDIKALKWGNIKTDKIQLIQAKTKVTTDIKLNQNAKQYLGESKNENEYVFNLPSHNGTLKNLEYWGKRAKIDKHITFHCARHTFGTLLAYYKTDIKTISELMGHTSLKHTTKYVRIADEMKEQAVNSLPQF